MILRAAILAGGLAGMCGLAAQPAAADSHSVTVVNHGTETIRSVAIGPEGAANRLRSVIPPGAQASITYSTGCQADVRIGYGDGRFEAYPGVDVCSGPRLVVGQGGPATAPIRSAPVATPTGGPVAGAGMAGAKTGSASPAAKAVAPPPVVPPWTGKSLTKPFGGLN